MQNLLRNRHFGARGSLRNPSLTFTVLLTLALGIGATTAIFTIDYASLIADAPFPNPDQLVVVWSKVDGHHNGVSAGDYPDWSRRNTTFQSLNAVSEGSFNISAKTNLSTCSTVQIHGLPTGGWSQFESSRLKAAHGGTAMCGS